MGDPSEIKDYHAHVYFDDESRQEAKRVREAVEGRFDVRMGRWHEKMVGPHPRWSYQIAFDPPVLDELLPWLMVNREGLTIFVHPNTGDDMADHTDYVAWLGSSVDLDIDFFKRRTESDGG
jgi:DOPA 4,5-dioxygenase